MTATDASQQLLDQLTQEQLPCQWHSCQQTFPSAEELYTHLTENHIGRKSTGNLNLQCKWGTCTVATVKRDHITSHVRVHVPLKPHTCNICNKSFKRPQDLKKHVKTHADDSVIVADQRRPGYPDAHGVYHGAPDQIDLRALAATATNYTYAASQPGFGHPSAPQSTYYAATAGAHQASNYGPVYYPVSHGGTPLFVDARRRAYDDMNDFFGDIKHHRITPAYTHDITQRLAGLHHILPVIHGGATAIDYQSPAGYSHYQLPHIPSLRTKSELLDGEHFLNQLSSTLLESPNAAAAAGVHQPGVHYAPAQLNFRSSHSPPQYPSHTTPPQRLSPGAHVSGAPMISSLSSTSSHNTSILTPPPAPHAVLQASSGIAYPNLAALASGDTSQGYPATSAAPTSTIGSAFARNQGHRVAGNLLQSARKDSEEVEHSDEAPSPTSRSTPGVGDRLAEDLKSVDISAGVADPQLAGSDDKKPSRRSSEADEWLEALRVVEALKEFVARRLANKEYADAEKDERRSSAGSEKTPSKDEDTGMSELEQDERNLYPILKAVQED